MSKFHCAVITIFPEMFKALTEFGVVGRAAEEGLLELILINPREYAPPPRRRVDERPYGGGPGMVMMAEPLYQAIQAAKIHLGAEARVVYLSPQGPRFHQKKAEQILQDHALILLCGRYEGVDQRLLDQWVDEEISLGDFVVSGGELPAMMLIDAVTRLVPGVLGDPESLLQESFQNETHFDYPVYTEPRTWQGQAVPEVLLSGHHQKIQAWREMQSIAKK